jgi:hypothetical protein
VSAFDFETKIDVIATYEQDVFVPRPVGIPWIAITRRLDGDGKRERRRLVPPASRRVERSRMEEGQGWQSLTSHRAGSQISVAGSQLRSMVQVRATWQLAGTSHVLGT